MPTIFRSIPARRVSVVALTSSLLALAGCTSALTPTASPNSVSVTGNWQVSSADPSATRLPMLTGELTGAAPSITGIVHSTSTSACVDPSAAISLTGAADTANNVTLTGSNLAGGTLTLKGTLAADGQSLSNATYTVTGGSCAFPKAAVATAQAYTSITGNYNGTFSDPDGQILTMTAALTQTPASDPNGNFQLSGSANFGLNPCFRSPVSVSNSQVTGGTFTLVYADTVTLNTVTAIGTFTPDGATLNVTSWILAGTCGADLGTGIMTKH